MEADLESTVTGLGAGGGLAVGHFEYAGPIILLSVGKAYSLRPMVQHFYVNRTPPWNISSIGSQPAFCGTGVVLYFGYGALQSS